MLICTNTMHNITAEIKAIIAIPILHIADATGQLLLRDKVTKVGLLGTSFTMQQDFHKGRLTDNFGTQVLVPNSRDQNVVNEIIYSEVRQGIKRPESKM